MRRELLIFATAGAAFPTLAAGAFALTNPAEGPITIHGSGSIPTTTGELPSIIKTLTFEFDRHGAVDTEGLEVCTAGEPQATTVKVARATCPNAIVGEGAGHAVVTFSEQHPIPISSPIALFNGPKVHGDDTVVAHAYVTVPAPVALIVPIVIEKTHRGSYGYRTEAKIPGGAGVPVSASIHIGKRWTYKGGQHSYLTARCEAGHFDAKGSFADGSFLQATFLRACDARA